MSARSQRTLSKVAASLHDPKDDNQRRRYRAAAVLAYYRRRFDQREPLDAVGIDLVADLMHYMNSPEFAHSWDHAKTWDDVARIAEGHYVDEAEQPR